MTTHDPNEPKDVAAPVDASDNASDHTPIATDDAETASEDAPIAPPSASTRVAAAGRAVASPFVLVGRAIAWTTRWTVRLLLFPVLVLCLLVALLTQTDTGRGFLCDLTVAVLNDKVLTGAIEIDRIDGTLFGDLQIHGLRLLDETGRLIVRVQAIELDYQLAPLLRREVVVDRVHLDRPVVRSRILEDGSLDLAGLVQPGDPDAPPSEPGDPWRIVLPSITIDAASATLRDNRNAGARLVVVRELFLSVSGEIHTELPDLRFELSALRASVAPPFALDTPFALRMDNLIVHLVGDRIDAELERLAIANTTLEELKAEVELDPTGEHIFERIAVELPELRFDPEYINAALGSDLLRTPVTIQAAVNGPVDAVGIEVEVRVDRSSIELGFEVDLTDPAVPGYRGAVELVRFRPEDWVDAGGLDANINLRLEASGRGITPEDAAFAARVDLAPSRVAGIGIEGLFASLAYAQRRAELRSFDAWSDGARVGARGSATLDGEITLACEASIVDLAALTRYVDGMETLEGAIRLDLDMATRVDPDEVAGFAEREVLDLAFDLIRRTRLHLQARVRGLQFDDLRVANASVEASTTADDLRVTADVRVTDLALPGAPVIRTLESALQWRDDRLDLSARVLDAERRSVQTDVGVVLQDHTITARVRSLEANASPLAVRLLEPLVARARFSDAWAFEEVDVTPFAVLAQGQRIDAHGAYHIRGTFRGAVQFANLRIADLIASLGSLAPADLPDVDGVLSVDAVASGSLARPEVTARVRLREATLDRISNVALDMEASYRARTARLTLAVEHDDEVLLSVDTGEYGVPVDLSLDGRAPAIRGDDPWSFAVDIPGLDLARYVSLVEAAQPFDLRGSLRARIRAGGRLSQPLGELRVVYSDGSVQIDVGEEVPLRLRGLGFGLALDVDAATPDSLQIKSTAMWENRRVAQIAGEAALRLRDALSGELTPEEWVQSLRGELDVLIPPIRLDQLPARVQQEVGIERATFSARVGLRGGIEGGELSARVEVLDAVMPGQPPVSARVDVRSGQDTAASVRAVVGNTLSARLWTDEGAWELATPALQTPADDETAAIRVQAQTEQGLFSLIRSGPDARAAVAARVHVEHVPARLLQDDESLEGVAVAGWVDLTGTPLHPLLRGRFAVDAMTLASGETARLGLEIQTDGPDIKVFVSSCAGGVETLTLDAGTRLPTWPLRPDFTFVMPEVAELPVHVELRAENAPLDGLVPEFLTIDLIDGVGGTLTANLDVDGSVGAPQVQGEVRIEGMRFGLIPLNRSFDRIDAHVELSNDEIKVNEILVRDGRGRLEVSGRAALVAFVPTELGFLIELDNFYAAGPTGPGAYVDGEVRIEGRERQDVLTVDVILAKMRVLVPDDTGGGAVGPTSLPESIYFLDETVPREALGRRDPLGTSRERSTASAEEEEQDQEGSGVALRADVRVRTTGTNRIEHSLARIDFSTDITARIRPEGIALNGLLSLPSGRINVAGRQFDIQRGFVQLNGDIDTLDPVVDLRAVHVLSPAVASRLAAPSGDRATVTIVVDGQVSELTDSGADAIRLVSDPEMSREDVLFVLLTGRPRESNSETDGQNQALATAGSLLLGLLGDRLAGGPVIDTLRIEGDAQTGQAISRVEGGKYISDDLYISGTFINSQDPLDNDFEVALQWIIARFRASSVRTELRAGNRGQGGVELLYFFTRRGKDRNGATP